MEIVGARIGTRGAVQWSVPAGQEITLLAYGISPNDAVFLGPEDRVHVGFLPESRAEVEEVSRPVTELWVRLVAHSADRPAAWVNTAQAGMAPREPFCE